MRLVGEEWIRSQVEISVKHSMTMGDMRTIGAGSQGASTKSLIGTYEYMSPEQKRGEDADKRSDVYALGLMCYRLLTGRNLSMKKPSAIIPGLVSGWDDFIAKAVEEEAAERYADAGEMLEEFKKITDDASTAREQSKSGIPARNSESEIKVSKTDDGRQKADEGKTSNQGPVTSNQGIAKTGKKFKIAAVLAVIIVLSILGVWKINDYSKNKAETERIAKLEKEKPVKISELLSKARSDFDSKKYAEASDAVRQVLEIDRNNSVAERLKKEILTAVGLSQVAPVKSKAEMKYAQIVGIDKGQGIGAIIDDSKLALDIAKTLFDKEIYGEAMGKYQGVISDCERVLKLDVERTTATEKRKQCELPKNAAERANTSKCALELWKSANEVECKAVEKFNAAEFAKSAELWETAGNEYGKAEKYSRGSQSVASARDGYVKAKSGIVKPSEFSNSDELLEKYGGSKWEDCKRVLKDADMLEKQQNWSDAASKYSEAERLISEAGKTAVPAAALAKKTKEAQAAWADTKAKVQSLLSDAKNISFSDLQRYESADSALSLLEKMSSYSYISPASSSELANLQSQLGNLILSLKLPGPAIGKEWTVPGIGMEFVWIKALDCWVGKYEVTNGEYRRFKPGHDSKSFGNLSLNDDQQPATMNYNGSVEFADWLTKREMDAGRLPKGYYYRLPNGNEWMIYAQCGDNREYPWGNGMPPKYGNYADKTFQDLFRKTGIANYDDGFAVTCPVEKSGKNDWGLYGVGGNLAEWTSEPKGYQILRGSSYFQNSESSLAASNRQTMSKDMSGNNGDSGVRLVLSR